MSDEPNKPDVLAILYDRLKDLQSQAVAIRDRVEEVELMIAAVERAGRKRPGPKPRVVPMAQKPEPITKETIHDVLDVLAGDDTNGAA